MIKKGSYLFIAILLVAILSLLILGNLRKNKAITQSIKKGINFLHESQLEYGEFRSYVCIDKHMTNCELQSSPLITTFVLYSLDEFRDQKTTTMKNKALNFIASEQQENGLWMFTGSRERSIIIPDLDDTSMASFVLEINDIDFRKNKAKIKSNVNEKGLFYTWFEAPKEENNIDCAVNANVLLYLGTENPGVCSLVNEAIDSKENCSLYYPDKMSLYYIISRAFENGVECFGDKKETIVNSLLERQQKNGSFGNELQTALSLNTLLNFGVSDSSVEKGITYLIDQQSENGSWERRRFFSGGPGAQPEMNLHWGSRDLTTAISLEALKKYSLIKASCNCKR